MATIVLSVKAKASARGDARAIAAEAAWALSALGFDVTVGGDMEWPAVESNGTPNVVARFEALAGVVGRRHEVVVEVAR